MVLKNVCRQCSRNIALGIRYYKNYTMSSYRFYSGLENYTPPPWANRLKGVPSCKVMLAQLNTPIHKWNLPGVPEGFEIFIKRDDMTGSTLSGNKVRKLEFLLADAMQKGCKHIITCGGIQSNHCRATAVAARQLGMKCHLVLRGDVKSKDDIDYSGNLFLSKMVGADLYFAPRIAPYETELKPRMEAIAANIEKKTGEKVYHICVGGSDPVGLFGYLNAFYELENQGVLENFDDIIFACGSGGTAEGLAIGNLLTGSELKIHGIAVSDSTAYFLNHIDKHLPLVGLDEHKAEDLIDIVEGYKGKGYGISTQEELDFIMEVSKTTGIMIDPVYTGKAVLGLVKELKNNPDRFKGKRILYIHTGGIFGMFDGRLNSTVASDETSETHIWPELDKVPWNR